MHDDLSNRDRSGEPLRPRGDRPERPADSSGPLSDREVPLASIASSDVIHRWLDGELPEPTSFRGDAARAVEFWRRVGDETERRKRVVTPAHVTASIMEAISALETKPAPTPWWKQELHISATRGAIIAAGAFGLGMLLMRALVR